MIAMMTHEPEWAHITGLEYGRRYWYGMARANEACDTGILMAFCIDYYGKAF